MFTYLSFPVWYCVDVEQRKFLCLRLKQSDVVFLGISVQADKIFWAVRTELIGRLIFSNHKLAHAWLGLRGRWRFLLFDMKLKFCKYVLKAGKTFQRFIWLFNFCENGLQLFKLTLHLKHHVLLSILLYVILFLFKYRCVELVFITHHFLQKCSQF